MKKLVLVVIVVTGATFLMPDMNAFNEKEINIELSTQTNYEEGWEDGYCEGWKDVKGRYALCPLTPLCPLPELECPQGYKCGYNRGFKAGMRAAKNN